MSNFQFDYDTFYKYYTNDDNIKTKDMTPKEIWFYRHSNSEEPEKDILSNKYILVNGIEVFISKSKENNDKDELFFTIPTEIENKLWDIHFHFGKDSITPPNKKYRSTEENKNGQIDIVFFHKTIQEPEKNGKGRKNCYYHQNMKIDNFGKIICLQATNSKMDEIFPPDEEDFSLIKEIISRPFPPLYKKKKRKKTNKKSSGKGGAIKFRRKSVRRR